MRLGFPLSIVLAVCSSFCNDAISQEIKSYTEPYKSVDVAAPEMGTLGELCVSEGQFVKRGEAIARLDDAVLKATLLMAQANVEATGQLESATAELQMHQRKYEKLKNLRDRRHATANELERAISELEIAKAKVHVVEEDHRLKTLEKQRIEAQIEQKQLRSPIDGFVTYVTKNPGEFVSMYEPNVAHVVQLDPLLAIFSVHHRVVDTFKVGQTVDVSMAGEKDKVAGEVEFISPVADGQSETVQVKVRIPNPNFKWRSGIACHLHLSRVNPTQPGHTPNRDQVVSSRP